MGKNKDKKKQHHGLVPKKDPPCGLEKQEPSPAILGIQPPQPISRELLQSAHAAVFKAELEQYCGPIPPPSMLKQYGEIDSSFPNRIMIMAEGQATHRQNLETIVIKSDISRSKMGLFAGVFVVILAFGTSIFFIYHGFQVWGGIVGGSSIIGLVSIFVYGSQSRRTERIKKAALMADTKKPKK
jgi:uncharacterized membrane protein